MAGFLAAKLSLAGSWQPERICHSMDTFIIGRKGSAIENVSLFCIIDQKLMKIECGQKWRTIFLRPQRRSSGEFAFT
jgi:hypothetical protein